MRPKERQHSISNLFCVLLLLMFAGSALILVLLGSRIYQNGVSHLNENYTVRTAIAYVSEKVRQHDEAGCISMETLDGRTALRLEETIDGKCFYTYIYFYNGSLTELFLGADTAASAHMGSKIVELSDFSVTEESGGFLRVTAAGEDGSSLSTLLYPAA